MSNRTELWCLWCMPVALAIFTVGWILSGYFPPASSNMSAHAFQAFFIHHASGMRAAVSLFSIGGVLTVPFAAAVTSRMLRIERRGGPLAYTQFAMGVLSAVMFIVPVFALAAAAYRPHDDPNLIRMLDDLWWLPYAFATLTFAGQGVAVGALALRRTASNPLPRWLGYACIVLAINVAPSQFVLSHKTGLLAPSGLFGLWVPSLGLYLMYLMIFVVFRRAASAEGYRQPRQDGSRATATPTRVPAPG